MHELNKALDIIQEQAKIIYEQSSIIDRLISSHIKTYVSQIIYNNQLTQGIIMATTFKKAEKVLYVIVFTDAAGGNAPVTDFQITSDTPNVNIVPDAALLTGTINGVNDGPAVVSWQGTSIGGVVIKGSITLTIADTPPAQPEAVNTSISLSDAQPQ